MSGQPDDEDSDGSRAASRSNAIEIRASRHSWEGPGMTGRMECSRCGQRATYEEHRDRRTEVCPGGVITR